MSSSTDGAPTATEQQEDEADDDQHDSDGPQDADPEDETKEQEDESKNNHVPRGTPAIARSNASLMT